MGEVLAGSLSFVSWSASCQLKVVGWAVGGETGVVGRPDGLMSTGGETEVGGPWVRLAEELIGMYGGLGPMEVWGDMHKLHNSRIV